MMDQDSGMSKAEEEEEEEGVETSSHGAPKYPNIILSNTRSKKGDETKETSEMYK